MAKHESGPGQGPTSAEDAGSLRGWLTSYFRRRLRSDPEVEDLVQDVFTRIVARDSTEPVEHLGGYILKTASSVLADWLRRRSTKGLALNVPLDVELHGEDEIDPLRVLGGREELHAVTAALLSLPERTRTVFILRRLEGQKYRDIAGRFGISVSAVEKHMLRAIQHLAQQMEKRRGA